MKVAQFSSTGKPENVIESVEAANLANPAENEVLIDVLACPINPADILTIEGGYGVKPDLPARLGAECVGKIKKVGHSVKGFKEGDIVLPLDRENWVQQKLVTEDNLILLPKNIDTNQLSMLKVNPATAYLMLKKYVNLKKGDWIIQDAANSGVGQCVIRLAKMNGIKTINIVRRIELEQELKNIGADIVLEDSENLSEEVKQLTNGAEIKLAIDAIGGDIVLRLGDCLTDEATILNYGLLSGRNIEMTSYQTVFKRLILTGFWLSPWLQSMSRDEVFKMYNYLAELIAKKSLYVPIEKTYNLDDIKDAVKHSAEYNRSGKIILTPNS
jgi:mitochondrial enoyl-[acyl-carrier protein] reductase / trans-2-enoyl-CoA reductase